MVHALAEILLAIAIACGYEEAGDIDDTFDVVHGHQQLSPFNAHDDDRCFLPIHVCDTATAHPVAMIPVT